MNINKMAQDAFANSVAHGFWEGKDTDNIDTRLAKIALICSEAGEAVEAIRNRDDGNLAEELADIVIRVGDLAMACELDLAVAVSAKMRKNRERPHMHGRGA